MRATEILRGILDLIDTIDDHETKEQTETAKEYYSDEDRRMEQVSDLVNDHEGTYANSPVAAYASIDAVTTNAGGGVNGPKHPRDLRGNSFPIHPDKE